MFEQLFNSINRIILSITHTFHHSYTQLGGLFIGKGAYGCVYRPAFDYDIEINSNGVEEITNLKTLDGYISKIMRVYSSQLEVQQNELINKIDPTHIFTLPILKVLEFNKNIWNTIETSDEIAKCDLFVKKTHSSEIKFIPELVNVIVKNGGTNFHNLITNQLTDMTYYLKHIDTIYSSFKPLFIGLKSMFSNNLIHHDIKSDNVTFDGIRSYLIDFGISQTIIDFINDRYIMDLIEFHSRISNQHENFEQSMIYNMRKSRLPVHYPPEYIIAQLAFVTNSDYIDLDAGLRIFKRSYPDFSDKEILTCLKSLRHLTDEYLFIIRNICENDLTIYGKKYTYSEIYHIFQKYHSIIDSGIEEDEINDIVDGFLNQIAENSQIIDFIGKLYSKFDTFSLGRVLYIICSLDKMMIEQIDINNIELKRKRTIINTRYMYLAKRMYCLDFNSRITVDKILSIVTHYK